MFCLPRKQVKFYIEEDLYVKLKNLAEELNLSVPQMVKNIVLESLGEAGDGNIVSRISELEAKYDQLSKELGRVEKEIIFIVKRCCKNE